MANTLYSKGYFSNGILMVETYPVADCNYTFEIDPVDGLPVIDVEEYVGGQWVGLNYEAVDPSQRSNNDNEYVIIPIPDSTAASLTLAGCKVIIPHATGKLYRIRYSMTVGPDCSSCGSCFPTSVCKAYVNTDQLRDVVLNLVGNMCSDACDVPVNLINKMLELMSLELAADKEGNCSMVAKLFDKYMSNLNLGSSSNCGCHG